MLSRIVLECLEINKSEIESCGEDDAGAGDRDVVMPPPGALFSCRRDSG